MWIIKKLIITPLAYDGINLYNKVDDTPGAGVDIRVKVTEAISEATVARN